MSRMSQELSPGPFITPFNEKRALLELPLLMVFTEDSMNEPQVRASQFFLDKLRTQEEAELTATDEEKKRLQEIRQTEEILKRSDVQTDAAIHARDELMKRLITASPERVAAYAKGESKTVESVMKDIENWKKTKALALYQKYSTKVPGYRMISFFEEMEKLNIFQKEAAILYQEVMTKNQVLAGTKELLPGVLDKATTKHNMLYLLETFKSYDEKGERQDFAKALTALVGLWHTLQDMKRKAYATNDFVQAANINLIMNDVNTFATDYAVERDLNWEVKPELAS